MERQHLIKLREVLSKRFGKGELRTLCFDLGIEYDDLPGEGRSDKARELVGYLERRDRISDLVRIGKRLRSDIPWPEIPEPPGETLSSDLQPPDEIAPPLRAGIQTEVSKPDGGVFVFTRKILQGAIDWIQFAPDQAHGGWGQGKRILIVAASIVIVVAGLLAVNALWQENLSETASMAPPSTLGCFQVTRSATMLTLESGETITATAGEYLLLSPISCAEAPGTPLPDSFSCEWGWDSGQVKNPSDCASVVYQAPSDAGRDVIGFRLTGTSGQSAPLWLNVVVQPRD